jgi:hypothetical protein
VRFGLGWPFAFWVVGISWLALLYLIKSATAPDVFSVHLLLPALQNFFMFFILPRPSVSAACKGLPFNVKASRIAHRLGGSRITIGLISRQTQSSSAAKYTTLVVDMETVDTSNRLSELRRLMKERNIDVYGPSPPVPNPRAALPSFAQKD